MDQTAPISVQRLKVSKFSTRETRANRFFFTVKGMHTSFNAVLWQLITLERGETQFSPENVIPHFRLMPAKGFVSTPVLPYLLTNSTDFYLGARSSRVFENSRFSQERVVQILFFHVSWSHCPFDCNTLFDTLGIYT